MYYLLLDIMSSILQVRQLKLRSHTFSKLLDLRFVPTSNFEIEPYQNCICNTTSLCSHIQPVAKSQKLFIQNSCLFFFLFFLPLLTATTPAQALIMVHTDDFNIGFSPSLLLSLSLPHTSPSCSYIPRVFPFTMEMRPPALVGIQAPLHIDATSLTPQVPPKTQNETM